MRLTFSCIYKIKLFDGRCYIGSAVNFDDRKRRHLHDLRHRKHHSVKLQRAWDKYGEFNFEFEILEQCDRSELIASEQRWIDLVHPQFNVERVAGSSIGRKHSEPTRKKMAVIAAIVQKGRKHSEESKLKRSLALRGIKPSPQCHAAKMRAIVGRKLSPEHRFNIASALIKYNAFRE
jgi:group I intron endonuclease